MESGSKIVPCHTELDYELAAGSSLNLLPGCSSLVCLREEDSLNELESIELHVVELKRWLKCRAATIVGQKQDFVKR